MHQNLSQCNENIESSILQQIFQAILFILSVSFEEELPEPSHSFLNVKLSPMETVSATVSWVINLQSFYVQPTLMEAQFEVRGMK